MAKVQEPSTELVVRSSNDLATNDDVLTELERVLITNEALPVQDDDPEAIAAEIVAQILAAQTDDELDAMQGGNAVGWRELLDVPVSLIGFRWRPSDYTEGASLYFVVFGTRLDNGDDVVLTTGGRNVMAQLVNRAKRGALTGAIVKLTEGDETKRGFKPLWLKSVDAGDARAAA